MKLDLIKTVQKLETDFVGSKVLQIETKTILQFDFSLEKQLPTVEEKSTLNSMMDDFQNIADLANFEHY